MVSIKYSVENEWEISGIKVADGRIDQYKEFTLCRYVSTLSLGFYHCGKDWKIAILVDTITLKLVMSVIGLGLYNNY